MRSIVILVVEDEALIRMAVVDLLEAATFVALEAADADEAIAVLGHRSDIRVMLTDIDMPGSMDGLALARVVRDRWPPIGIIVISGRHLLTEGELPSGSRFFGKPIDERRLIAAVRELAT